MAVIEREAKIVNPLGMHARPAAELVKIAGRFKSSVQIRKDDVEVNGKSILGVMTLAAECGSSIWIRTDSIRGPERKAPEEQAQSKSWRKVRARITSR